MQLTRFPRGSDGPVAEPGPASDRARPVGAREKPFRERTPLPRGSLAGRLSRPMTAAASLSGGEAPAGLAPAVCQGLFGASEQDASKYDSSAAWDTNVRSISQSESHNDAVFRVYHLPAPALARHTYAHTGFPGESPPHWRQSALPVAWGHAVLPPPRRASSPRPRGRRLGPAPSPEPLRQRVEIHALIDAQAGLAEPREPLPRIRRLAPPVLRTYPFQSSGSGRNALNFFSGKSGITPQHTGHYTKVSIASYTHRWYRSVKSLRLPASARERHRPSAFPRHFKSETAIPNRQTHDFCVGVGDLRTAILKYPPPRCRCEFPN